MKVKRLAVLNSLSVVFALFVSYFTQTIRLNGNTMGSLSREYYDLFTPADYAFAIWGLIYFALVALAVYQIYQAFGPKKNLEFLIKSKYWLMLANLATGTWVIVWLYEWTGLSVILMLLILLALIKVILHTGMELKSASLSTLMFCWWPVCLYSGWIAVATIANIAAYLSKAGWDGAFLSEEQWTIIMIIVASVLNIAMVFIRNMREFAAVGIWALFAIYLRHEEGEYPVIAHTALISSAVILVVTLYHAFKNRKSNRLYKKILG